MWWLKKTTKWDKTKDWKFQFSEKVLQGTKLEQEELRLAC